MSALNFSDIHSFRLLKMISNRVAYRDGETDDFTIEALSDDSSDRESLSPPHLPPPLLLSLSTTPSPKILMHCSHISRKAFLHIGSLMMRNNTKHPTIITNYYKSSSGTDELKRLK
jgi:hypothetical protein